VPNIEEELAKIADEDGEIRYNDFMKFATPTDLCKVDPLRGGSIFGGNKDDDDKAKKKDSKKGKVSVCKDDADKGIRNSCLSL